MLGPQTQSRNRRHVDGDSRNLRDIKGQPSEQLVKETRRRRERSNRERPNRQHRRTHGQSDTTDDGVLQTGVLSGTDDLAAGQEQISFKNELSDTERQYCLRRLQAALGAYGLDECVCAMCDRLCLRRDSRRMKDTDWCYMDKMKATLSVVKANLPGDLVDQYRAPAFMEGLKDVMVSPRGIKRFSDENDSPRAWFTVCKECNRWLDRGKLPKFAIANGFYVGNLPQPLNGLTLPERFMTQLVSIVALTRVGDTVVFDRIASLLIVRLGLHYCYCHAPLTMWTRIVWSW